MLQQVMSSSPDPGLGQQEDPKGQACRGAGGQEGGEPSAGPLGQGVSLFGQLPRLPDHVNRTYREQSTAGFLKLLVPCTHETPNLPLGEPVNSICAFRHRKRAPQAGILLPQAQF